MMGSVINCGGLCPVCGRKSLISDYYYRTGEEHLFCSCCGYVRNSVLERDEKTHDILFRKERDIVLSENTVFLGAYDMENNYELIEKISLTADMVEDDIANFMNQPWDPNHPGICRNIFEEKDNEEPEVLFRGVTKFNVKDGVLSILRGVWTINEGGGWGQVELQHKKGLSSIHSFDSKPDQSEIDSIMENNPGAKIAVFDRASKQFSFFGIEDPEAWFAAKEHAEEENGDADV